MIKSKAPFRIGLAGGGTDVPPYSTMFGGAVINTTIDLYAHVSLEVRSDNTIEFNNLNLNKRISFNIGKPVVTNDESFFICIGVYNRIKEKFEISLDAFTFSYKLDVPSGKGLGGSSSLIVASIGAFDKYFNLNLCREEIAELAIDIERVYLKQPGGKQDQYAATFGGFNFFEFTDIKVVIEKLDLSDNLIIDLSDSLLLYDTEVLRKSGEIMVLQQENIKRKKELTLDSLHFIKEQALTMKSDILANKMQEIGSILHAGWINKRNVSNIISTPQIDGIYNVALSAGALGGKVLGAGGGGYMLFYCPINKKEEVSKAILSFGGHIQPFDFENKGLQVWEE